MCPYGTVHSSLLWSPAYHLQVFCKNKGGGGYNNEQGKQRNVFKMTFHLFMFFSLRQM